MLRCNGRAPGDSSYGSNPRVVTKFAARLFIPHKLTVEERTRNGTSDIHSTFSVDCSVHQR